MIGPVEVGHTHLDQTLIVVKDLLDVASAQKAVNVQVGQFGHSDV